MTATYKHVNINNHPANLSDAGFYADIRFDASDAQPDYIGLHLTNGAATSDEEWKVLKFTYSGSDTTRIQVSYGAWDDRATLF